MGARAWTSIAHNYNSPPLINGCEINEPCDPFIPGLQVFKFTVGCKPMFHHCEFRTSLKQGCVLQEAGNNFLARPFTLEVP